MIIDVDYESLKNPPFAPNGYTDFYYTNGAFVIYRVSESFVLKCSLLDEPETFSADFPGAIEVLGVTE